MENLIRKRINMFESYLKINIMEYNFLRPPLFCPSGGERHVKLITLYLPEPYIKALDKLVNERYYPNRAEAIRVAIRDLLNVEVWRTKANG